jgi:hypothetical protein
MQKQATKLSIAILILLIVAGCTGKTTIQEVETPELQLLAEGPFYQGANSATATWEFDLTQILGNAENKVAKAKITAVEVVLKDSENVPALEKMVFEVTSKNTSMTRIGLYEGAITQGQTFTLNIADDQENLATAFADGKITFVGDFDLLDEEYSGNIEFILKVKFELGIK